jgi:hypothetical protein
MKQLNSYSEEELKKMLFEFIGDEGIVEMIKKFEARTPRTDAYSDAEMRTILEENSRILGAGYDEVVMEHRKKYPTAGYLE